MHFLIDKLIYLGDKEAARRMLLSMKYDLEGCCNSADKYVEKEVLELSEPLFKKIEESPKNSVLSWVILLMFIERIVTFRGRGA